MVRTGCDILRAGGFMLPAGARIGLLANQASVTSSFEHSTDVISRSSAILSCIFGPQHGLWSLTQANMLEWEGYEDSRLGVPVHSLYGTSRKPRQETLEGLDAVVIDLQDVGSRPYTYVWTALLMMRSCAEAGVEVIALDRPNPIGGARIEGPLLEEGFESFVGMYPLAMRHGMTIGEILLMINGDEENPCGFEVVRMEGWNRGMMFGDTGLPWVMPSPNMPTTDTALIYPGMVLLEGTNISEGRGTTRPFELAGAPWIDPYELASELDSYGIEGAVFRPAFFRPVFDKYAGKDCGGVQVHPIDRESFRPVLCAVAVISAAARLYPGDFSWLDPPYEYEREKMPIDIIYGGRDLRDAVESGAEPTEIARGWSSGEKSFLGSRAPFLLYD
jgi:uncharacterized protein YbbC (DUF1343 family)